MDRRTLFKLTGAGAASVALGAIPSVVQAKEPVIKKAYRPGVLPRLDRDHPLLLNFNENAIGMAASAKKAVMGALDKGFRYPDDQRAELIETIAQQYGVSEKHISLGNGSSENIQAVVQALIHRARSKKKDVQLVVPDPTFDYAEVYAKTSGVPVVKIPLTADFRFDIPAMQKAASSFRGHTVFYLCNPNNPTAMVTPDRDLRAWIDSAPNDHFFLLDEAYAEFVADAAFRSGIDYVKGGYKNVMVTRTFSKLFALAGFRVGYCIASEELTAAFNDFLSIDNTNLAGAVAATASMKDDAFRSFSVSSVARSRSLVENALVELGLRFAPSGANFIFHEVKGDVATYRERMKSEHIYVGRLFPPIEGWNRLTLGTPEEMTVFVRMLKTFRQKGWV